MGVAPGRGGAGGGDANLVEAERGEQGLDHVTASPVPVLGEGVTHRTARRPEGSHFSPECPRRLERLSPGRILSGERLNPGLELLPHAGGAEPPVRMDLGHHGREAPTRSWQLWHDRAHGRFT